MTRDEIKQSLIDLFVKTDLYDQFVYGDYSEAKVNIGFDKYDRLQVMSLPTLYRVENIVDIFGKNYDVKRNTRKDNCNFTSILFDDGSVLKCVLHGLEFADGQKTYHGREAVSYRLNYLYRTKIAGLNVNPLIIKDRVVVTYCGNSERIVVPEGVVKIGDYAFENSCVKRLAFPRTLREISNSSFLGCNALVDIAFDGRDEYIGDDILNKCEKGKKLEIPDRIKVDRVKAFADLGFSTFS